GVERERARPMRVLDIHRNLVVPVKLAHAAWLFLREQQPAVRRADKPVGVVAPLPHQRPSCTGSDDARNRRDRGVTDFLTERAKARYKDEDDCVGSFDCRHHAIRFLKYRPVYEALQATMSSGVPVATTLPPA